jgi:hypothetical protein
MAAKAQDIQLVQTPLTEYQQTHDQVAQHLDETQTIITVLVKDLPPMAVSNHLYLRHLKHLLVRLAIS